MIWPKHIDLKILSVKKIWDHAPHNALTDLILYHDKWFCTFRESDKHVHGRDGAIRIISSQDLTQWKSVTLLTEQGVDLRDPKLSIASDGRLMLLAGGTLYSPEGEYITRQSRVTFSSDGENWEPFVLILEPHEWLWRVTWHEGKAYGVSYRYSDPKERTSEWKVNLFQSTNGIDYQLLAHWDVPGYPNETTLRFLKTGEMIALLRRDKYLHNHAWIGISEFPYIDCVWHATKHYFGGPNFLVLDDGTQWAAGRICAINPYGLFEKTALAAMGIDHLTPILVLPSGYDTSYPGMVYHNGQLWISYYSSHEDKTSIYLACIELKKEEPIS